MTQFPSNCPFNDQSLNFSAYTVRTDFLYDPEDGKPSEHIVSQYRYEHPDALIARDHAVEKVLNIKRKMELGSNDPDFTYDLTGLELELEFVAEPNGEDQTDMTMQHRILDSEPLTEEGLKKNIAIERCLLKRMGFDLDWDDPLIEIIEAASN